ncbi:hypothetical protein PS850_00378 [Pseudomonas fluorescens]|nr:hypothetical protein PS850_00378 [Pseudomonas fluorescens]
MKKPGYHTRSLNWQRLGKIIEMSSEAQAHGLWDQKNGTQIYFFGCRFRRLKINQASFLFLTSPLSKRLYFFGSLFAARIAGLWIPHHLSRS